MLAFLSIAVATFVSEDLTCVATGLLIQRGEIGAIQGVFACAAGIFAGDLGLWAVGRAVGLAMISWPGVARLVEQGSREETRRWIEHHAGRALVSSRFLPGTRL